MSVSIETKYLGPTNFRGSRIVATTANGQRLVMSADHSSRDPHIDAAVALAVKMGWHGQLVQGVTKAGIKATPAEVETQFQAVLKQTGGAEGLAAELTKSNLTEAQLRENISKQLAVQAYLLQNIDVKSITVTDAEVAQFYADYSKAQKDAGVKTVPALKELSAQIKQQITANKEQTLIVNFIASLRAAAKVETTL